VQPFAPPREATEGSTALLVALTVWLVAGACVGLAIGVFVEINGVLPAVLPASAAGAGLFGVAGVGAARLERRMSERRTAVVDARGTMQRPVAGWVTGVPLGLVVASCAALVVLGTVRADSMVPGVAFGLIAVGVATLFVPLASRQAIARAVEAVEQGRHDEARARFLAIAGRPWVGESRRSLARLNLGLLALIDGDLQDAMRWYDQVRHPRITPFAPSGTALPAVLAGDYAKAEDRLGRAMTGATRAVQGEVDGVRALLVLERDGPAEALDLCERISGGPVGALFLGVMAAAKAGVGDRAGAEAILTPDVRASLLASGIGQRVPALAALLEG